MNLKNFTNLWQVLLLAPFLFMMSCSEDPVEPAPDAVASFQFEVDADNYLTVHFTSFSQNAASQSWDFGDGGTSTDVSPSYTYSEAGDYTVTLTATNADGVSATKSEAVTITDPNEALKLLTGEVSKTWKLFREGTSMSLGPDANSPASWWEGLTNDGSRACMYEQTFTFGLDGSYVFDDGGTFWGEYGVWGAIDGFDNTANFEVCFEATAGNMVNAKGEDVSAWLSGTHEFAYDASTGSLTLTGMGAWIGIPKLGTTGETLLPVAETSAQISIEEFTGYDVMKVEFIYDGVYWPIYYASYSDAGLEPELVTEVVEVPCDPLPSISPTEISHTFASNDAADWTLLQFIPESGSGLELGVDDPTDANATKVGKYTRHADVQFQELQFKLDPANAINFENISTISVDVYMPAGNAYDAANLTDNVFIGLGAITCPPNWWEDLHEYQQLAVAKDTWVTITFDITAPSYVAVPDNGATAKDRNDLDMIYIAIGGGGHGVGAEFYIRNLSFQ